MLLFALLACGSTEATPIGALGESGPLPLPAGAAPSGEITVHQLPVEVCAWPEHGQPASLLDIRWRSQAAGEDRYVLDYAVALTRPSPEVEVTLVPDAGLPAGASLVPDAPWIGVATVTVRCHRAGRSGCQGVTYDATEGIQIRADGQLH